MATIVESKVLHRGWTALLRLTIEDGESTYFRKVEDHGNAAAVLPFDPLRRKAVLVRLLRGPMLLSGDDGLSLAVSLSRGRRSPKSPDMEPDLGVGARQSLRVNAAGVADQV